MPIMCGEGVPASSTELKWRMTLEQSPDQELSIQELAIANTRSGRSRPYMSRVNAIGKQAHTMTRDNASSSSTHPVQSRSNTSFLRNPSFVASPWLPSWSRSHIS